MSARVVETCVAVDEGKALASGECQRGRGSPLQCLRCAGSVSPFGLISPKPISAAVRWASGARSPEAPTEPFSRNHRQGASAFERGGQGLDHHRPNAGEPRAPGSSLHRDQQAHDTVGQGRAGADRMGQDEVALERGQISTGDAHAGELAEAGIDAIDHGRPPATISSTICWAGGDLRRCRRRALKLRRRGWRASR